MPGSTKNQPTPLTQFLAAVESEARRLLALTEEGTLGQPALEGLLAFATGGVAEAFQ